MQYYSDKQSLAKKDIDIENIDKRKLNTTWLVKKTDFKTKVTVIGTKIPNNIILITKAKLIQRLQALKIKYLI